MSNTIDEKVVEMRFDNKNFEQNVKTSLSTLDTLKQSLRMDGAEKGLENVDKTAKEISFEKIAAGVEALQQRFSAFGIVGMRVLENITDSVMNLANKLISFLTDSVVQGGITRAMNIENAHFMLQGLIQDEEKVQKVMDQASASVDGTAYSYDEAAKAASQFMASGVEEGEQLKTALQGITGVAAMTNSEYEGISRIFTEVAGNGRLMGDQLLQLSNRGMNAAAILKDFFNGVNDGSKVASEKVTAMVKSLMGSMNTAETETTVQKEALQKQYEQQVKADDKAYEAKKKAFDKSYNALSESLDKEIEAAEKASSKKLEKLTKSYEDDVTAFQKATEEKVALIDKEYEENLKLIDKEEYDRIKAIDDQIDSINAEAEAEEKARGEEERRQKLAELQKAINTAESAEERQKAEDALTAYNEQLAQKELAEQRKARINALNDEKAAIKEETSAKKEAAQEQRNTAVNAVQEESNEVLTEKYEQYAKEYKALTDSEHKQLEALKASKTAQLSALKESQSEQLAYFKEVQQEKTKALKKSIEEQEKALKTGLSSMEITEADIRQLVSEGKINFDIFSEAMNEAFGEHAKNANQTFTGALSNIKAALARIGAGFVSPLIEQNGAIVKLFNTIRERVNDVKKALVFDEAIGNTKALSKQFTDTVIKIANSATKYLSKLDVSKPFEVFYNVLESIKNVMKGFGTILKPIAQAFSDIFPPVTINTAVSFSEKLKDLTSKFKLNKKDADNLKSTFKGLFAVIDICKQAFAAIISAILPLTPTLGSVGSGILGVTGKIGEWLTSLDEAIKKNNAFTTAIQTVKDKVQAFKEFVSPVFEVIGKAIRGGIDAIKEFAKTHFTAPSTSSLDKFTENIKTKFKPLEKIAEVAKKILGGIFLALKSAASILLKVGKSIGESLGDLGKSLSDTLVKGDFSGFLDLLNGGVLISIGAGITKFINSLTSTSEKAGGFFSSIGGMFSSVKDTLTAYQKDIKANVITKIATAIAILTASMVVLSLIDSKKLSASLAALTGLFADLTISMGAFEKIMGSSGFDSMGKATSSMIKMSAAVLILSIAMKKLADIDEDALSNGLVAVMTLMGSLVASAIALSKWGGKIQTSATGMILFAAAINVLAIAVKKLGELDPMVMIQGLGGMGAVFAELVGFIKLIGEPKKVISTATGVTILASAMLIFKKAIEGFGSLDAMAMIQGLGGMGAVLAEMVGFIKLIGEPSKVVSTATGVTILAGAMLILEKAVDAFGSLDSMVMIQGLGGIGAVLAEVAGAMKLMPTTTPVIAAGMVLVGAALKIIASAMADFGSMSWEAMAKSLITLTASLVLIVGAVNLMKTALPGAAAMLVMAAALNMLTPALKAFGDMSLAEIGKSMLMLAGSFVVIGAAGVLLSPVVPSILGLAGAIALLGVGALACGAGVLAFSAGLAALSVSGAAAISTLILAIEAIVGLIPFIQSKIAEGIVSMITVIGNSAPKIAKAVVKIVKAVAKMLVEAVGPLAEALVSLLEQLLITISNHLPTILQTVMDILKEVLTAIRDNIGEIVTIVIDVILETLEAIANKLPDIIQTGIDIVVNLIDGLAQGLEDNAERLREAFLKLFKSVLETVLTFLGIHSPSTKFAGVGTNIILGLIKGIGDKLKNLLAKIREVLTKMVDTIKNKLSEFFTKGQEAMIKLKDGIANKIAEVKNKVGSVITGAVTAIKNKANEFKTKGQELITKLKTGISDKAKAIKNAAKNIISGAINTIKGKFEDFKNIGGHLIDGLKKGISNAASGVVDTVNNLAGSAVDIAKNVLGIHSPSTEFIEIGENVDKGFVVGIEKFAKYILSACKNVGKNAVGSMSDSLSGIADIFADDMDYEPVIRPVLDLTNIESGIKDLDGMLYTQRSIELAASTGANVNSTLDRMQIQNGIPENDNSDILRAIKKLREDVSSLAESVSKMKVVMDTGSLVGALAEPMNNALGRKLIYEKRGI